MSDVLRIIHLETERDALAARLAEVLQANTEVNAQCMKEAARADDAEARLAEAERLLRKCRDEMGRLPRSLGYDFTHTPELDKFLGAADSAPAVPSVAALYNELLYAVASKYPGESRHDTALRYIRDRETLPSHGPSETATEGAK